MYQPQPSGKHMCFVAGCSHLRRRLSTFDPAGFCLKYAQYASQFQGPSFSLLPNLPVRLLENPLASQTSLASTLFDAVPMDLIGFFSVMCGRLIEVAVTLSSNLVAA